LAIQYNRTLGGLGAIFSLLGVISTISSLFLYNSTSTPANMLLALVTGVVGLFSFVGFILFLIAMYGFSKDYNDNRIFNYLIYGFVGTFIAAVLIGIIGLVVLLLYFGTIFPPIGLSTASNPGFQSPITAVFSLAGLIWILFNVKAFRLLGAKSGVPLFRTAAFILLSGAIVSSGLALVFASLTFSVSMNYNTFLLVGIPGGVIQDIAWLLIAKAFFQIKVPTTETHSSSYVSPVSTQVKYCSYCGTSNQLDGAYCTRCGQKL
jgi:uncharacterized membrane protein